MRGFSFALGTRCEHCNVEKAPGSHDLDFAADDKQEKIMRLPGDGPGIARDLVESERSA